jgi:hypothetical protein
MTMGSGEMRLTNGTVGKRVGDVLRVLFLYVSGDLAGTAEIAPKLCSRTQFGGAQDGIGTRDRECFLDCAEDIVHCASQSAHGLLMLELNSYLYRHKIKRHEVPMQYPPS